MSLFRSLLAAIRRFFSRRAARRLIAEHLPKGLLPAPFRLALRIPRALDDAPPGEFWTLPLGAQAIRGTKPSPLFPHAAAARAGQLPPPPAQFPARQGLAQAGQRGHRPPRNPRHHLPLGSPRLPPPLARAALDGAGTDFLPRPPAVRVVPDVVGRVP